MRHFTQRLMMAIVATFMAVSSLWAETTITSFGTVMSKSSDNYYSWVATESCDITVTVTTGTSDCSIYWDFGHSWSFSSQSGKTMTVSVTSGQDIRFFISLNGGSGGDYTVTFTKSGADGPETPPAVVYNAPVISGATNSGVAAGSKMSMLSENFYLTLSEASNYAGNGVSYQYDGVTDWDATVNVSMNAEGTVATVNVSGVDLTREGEHSIYVIYGAFVNANDDSKVLTSGQKFNWYIGDYAIIGANANGVEPGSDEIDNKMFKNAFYLSLNYPSTPKSSFSVKLKKDGAEFLTSTAKPTKMDGAGMEWQIVFSSWSKVNYTYAALEPGVYTLELPAGAFTNDLIGGESTAAYNVSWNVIHKVYPWSLVTTSVTAPVKAGEAVPGDVNAAFSHVFNVTFDGKYSNVAQGAGAITLTRDDVPVEGEPVVAIYGNNATITFGEADFTVDGVYALSIAEGAFTATYKQDGDATATNNVNCAQASFSWNVTVPAVVYNAPNIVSATNDGNPAGTVAEVSNVFVLTFDEETQWLGTSYYSGVSYQFNDVTEGTAGVVMSADKRTATITITGADAYLTQNGEHKLNITVNAFANANDETKTVAAANYVWTREGVETFDVKLSADGYASFCWDKNWTIPSGVTIYKATAQESDMILIKEVSGVIPANAGVILYAPGETQVTATATEDGAITLDDNILKGTTVLTVNPACSNASVTVYAMHYVGEATNATVFDSYVGDNIPANKAYIQLGAGAPARLRVAMAGNTTTGMEAAATVNGGVSKRLVNGQLFILRDGKMYNVQGAVVK